MLPTVLDLPTLSALYRSGAATPLDVMEEIIRRRAGLDDRAVFITETDDESLRDAARQLMAAFPDPQSLPLWGVPCAVKDNIDVAGLPTTAACPAFAYGPEEDATVIARLRAAGAIVIGKTNLDQFATGLNGTRSPYGAPRSVFDSAYISGGSSSGSAVAVAAGLASFSLGTDTAGSGRVPAAFNNLVGIKPTLGLVSTRGVVPACRTLDCVSIFSLTVSDGVAVRRIAEGWDDADPFSRRGVPVALPGEGLRIGVLEGAEREFDGNGAVEAAYDRAIEAAERQGATIVPFDYAPFRAAAELLYGGPWVAERRAAIADFFEAHEADMDPTVAGIIGDAGRWSAVDAFAGRYRLGELRRAAEREWSSFDVMLLPTAPTTYTVAEMTAEPVTRNSHLGRYTNFVNLFDYAAIAIPAGFDAQDHLPAGVTLVGPAFSDDALAGVAAALHQAIGRGMGKDKVQAIPTATITAPANRTPIVVVGAHLSGMPLNKDLVALGGRLLRRCRTAGDYRLFALPATTPPKPGLVRSPGFDGHGIAVEVWDLPLAAFGSFVAAIPAPLGIGKITLDDGSTAPGFLCEQHAIGQASEITAFGGWRNYVDNLAETV
jgi:allophanate hydrolase